MEACIFHNHAKEDIILSDSGFLGQQTITCPTYLPALADVFRGECYLSKFEGSPGFSVLLDVSAGRIQAPLYVQGCMHSYRLLLTQTFLGLHCRRISLTQRG